MVAVAGTIDGVPWKLAPSLVALIAEADRLYPDRDSSTDGSIGDPAHAARTSDHNPYDGWVHAVDLDEDLTAGLDLKGFAETLRVVRDRRVRYLIYEGRICKSYVSAAGPAWVWLPYTGPNPHAGHLHISISRTDEARFDTSPWFHQEDDMPLTKADIDNVANEIIRRLTGDPGSVNDLRDTKNLVASIHQTVGGDLVNEAEIIRQVLAGLDAETLTDEKVAAIIAAMPEALKQALREGVG